MSRSYRKLRFSVRNVDGQWELEHGGIIPVVDGARAELIIAKSNISDESFLGRMTERSFVKVLDQGVELLVHVVDKGDEGIAPEHRRHLVPASTMRTQFGLPNMKALNFEGARLVPITLGSTIERQQRHFSDVDGGLWLVIEGQRPIGLESSSIQLPKGLSEEPASSLNHAFTRLSEMFEPWRISHTGNVYERVLYQEANGRWYPLSFLRDAAKASQEEKIAFKLWQDFIAKVSSDSKPTGK